MGGKSSSKQKTAEANHLGATGAKRLGGESSWNRYCSVGGLGTLQIRHRFR